ncbi:aminoacyl-histidine dipeptidase [Campylobacter sp. FMV-PI01]|uniref:Aminoacyl-histidine dipeptidase n=1 Tax=Campylobacter portucalensis TaxID=2608384 RepID=A0A6L5WIQ6_9BACT|nr:M20/M25/M40 family metallo-hydrolase [Campylobacter portucalensis]MSN97120.1 aminoacyl-histidine dipeptidase [Campylobacter portucalensis]
MKTYMEYFKEICTIPHASFETDKMQEFLVNHCKKNGFEVSVDKAGNIHAFKGKPRICLQAHYDMVCVGDAPNIKLIQKDGFLSAKNSSLGADNGVGVAYMMCMMDRYDDFEVIFTNNEEVGLWGVAKFEGVVKSPNLLNLDSEEDDRVSIGCAGSVDIDATIKIDKTKSNGYLYELVIDDFPGGHSGIEIHKNIPNSIKFIAKFIKENKGKIVEFNAGERRNSIAANAKVKAIFDKELGKIPDYIKAEFFGKKDAQIYTFSDKLLNMLCIFSQGVRAFNTKLNIPEDSINLSTAKEKDDVFEVLFFARSMSKDGLENSKFETIALAKSFGFDVRTENQTTPWKPEINEFSEYILNSLKKYKSDVKFTAVHAGLECGVFLAKQPNLKVTSIGPNIFSPHSINERFDMASGDLIFKAVDEIVKNA